MRSLRVLLPLLIFIALAFYALSQWSVVYATAAVIRVAPAGATNGTCGDQTNWSNPCDLQYALTTVAISGDELWVKQGTYKPTTVITNANAYFQLRTGIALYGGFAGTEAARDQRDFQSHLTILSGDIDGNDLANPATNTNQLVGTNSYTVVKGNGTDSSAVLDGFTITAGRSGGSGAGMANNAGSPTVQNVVFSGNQADAGAGMYNLNSNPTVHRVTFLGNRTDGDFSSGGGMYNYNSGPTVLDVVFDSNDARFGGGMTNSSSNPALVNVTFSDNTATYGAAMYAYNSSPILNNVSFSHNVAVQQGGGIYNFSFSNPLLVNVTFSGNQAGANDGGAIYNLATSAPLIHNSIFWGDTTPEILNSSSAPAVNDSIVQGGCPAGATCANIVDADPVLSALANHGGFSKTLAIAPDGAATDAGKDATCTTSDQRGISRPQGAHCDMGAFEISRADCTQRPVKPLLKAPADNATLVRARATLKWLATTCADTYKVIVRDATTGEKSDRKTGLTVLKYRTVALPNGTYKWVVKACNDLGCRKSLARQFTIAQ